MSRKSHSIPRDWNGSDQSPHAAADSLVVAKPASFGLELRLAIKAAFGTNREFAKALGVTEGRVSQLLSGSESVTASTLEEVLSTFPSFAIREAVHAAWVRTFAPPPSEWSLSLAPNEQARVLFEEFTELIALGRARHTLQSFLRILPYLDPIVQRQALRATIDLALYLDRPTLARIHAHTLLEIGQEENEPRLIATGLWCLASSARVDPEIAPGELSRSHEKFVTFIQAVDPKATSDLWREFRIAATRDRALTILALFQRVTVAKQALSAGIEPLDKILNSNLSPEARAVCLEVLGRLLVASNAPVAAEDALDEIRAISTDVSYDHGPKTRILGAQITIARKDLSLAQHQLLKAIELCHLVDDFHHANRAERLLLGISREGVS